MRHPRRAPLILVTWRALSLLPILLAACSPRSTSTPIPAADGGSGDVRGEPGMPGAEAAGHVTGAGTGVDPARSPAPCGARGTLCFPGQTCTQGHCVGTGALTPADLARALRSKDFLLLNVHAPAGIISGTDASISHEDPDQLARRIGPDPRARVVLYCRTSLRSGDALRKLRARGYQSVSYLDGGVLAWRQAGYLLTP